MKKIGLRNWLVSAMGLVILLALASCDEKEEAENQKLSRLFGPALFTNTASVSVVTGMSVQFSWLPIKNADCFLEISRDSLAFNQLLISEAFNTKNFIVIDTLWASTRYSARIKAISKDPEIPDSEFNSFTFTTSSENIYLLKSNAVDPNDIYKDHIVLRWDFAKEVTHLIVSSPGVADVKVLLSATEKAAGVYSVNGLKANTEYIFKLYRKGGLRGTVTVKTKS